MLRNSGKRKGVETLQLYLGLPYPEKTKAPPLQLKGFAKTALGPGESTVVRFALTSRHRSTWDEKAHACLTRTPIPTLTLTLALTLALPLALPLPLTLALTLTTWDEKAHAWAEVSGRVEVVVGSSSRDDAALRGNFEMP